MHDLATIRAANRAANMGALQGRPYVALTPCAQASESARAGHSIAFIVARLALALFALASLLAATGAAHRGDYARLALWSLLSFALVSAVVSVTLARGGDQ